MAHRNTPHRWLIGILLAALLFGSSAPARALWPPPALAAPGSPHLPAADVSSVDRSDEAPGHGQGGNTSHETSHAALHAIPSADGTSLFLAAERLGGLTAQTNASLTIGGTSHEPSHSDCDPSSGLCEFAFEAVLQPFSTSLDIRTTVTATHPTSGTVILADSNFDRTYLPGDEPTFVYTRDTMSELFVPVGSLMPESYLVMMDAVGLPGDLPSGHVLVNKPYSIRASGAITQSITPLLLKLFYPPDSIANIDPHRLSIYYWDAGNEQWLDMYSEPTDAPPGHAVGIRRFGTYALLAGAAWRDTFQDYSGVIQRQNLELIFGGRLALLRSATHGRLTSVAIAPPDPSFTWGNVSFTRETPAGTALRVDVLAADGSELLHDVASGASLAGISVVDHPSLRLRGTFDSPTPGLSPYLDQWSISWSPQERRFFLPLIIRRSSNHNASSFTSPGPSDGSTIAPISYGQTAWAASDTGPHSPSVPPVWVNIGLVSTLYGIPTLAIDPRDRNVVWATTGSAGGRVYKTVNGGQTWNEVLWQGASISSHAVAIAPGNPDVMVIGRHTTPLKSLDGGSTWAEIANCFDYHGDIAIAPTHSDTIYMVGGGGAWGLCRSINGGASWQRVLGWIPHSPCDAETVAIDPLDANIVYGGTRNPDTYPELGGIFRSVGGVTWTRLMTTPQVNALAIDPVNTNILYVATETEGIFKSTDSGATWATINTGLTPLAVRALAIDPTQPSTIYAGTWEGGVFKSVDSGLHWSEFNEGLTNRYVLSLAIDPTEARVLYVGTNQGGVFKRVLLPEPPPPGSTYLTVLDANDDPVEDAQILINGQWALDPDTDEPLLTDAAGNVVLTGVQAGNTVVAMHPVQTQPSARPNHAGWAYRIYNTSLRVVDDAMAGEPIVNAPGQTVLHVNRPLILLNLVLSTQWNATPEYTQELARAVSRASEYLFDVTDGQFAVGQAVIYDDAGNWSSADIQVLARNTVRPYAYVRGIVSADPAEVLRIGRQWDRSGATQGPWDQPDGYRTIVHELGHYVLGLYDSYFAYVDTAGVLTGVANSGCTKFNHQDYQSELDHVNASIMDFQYRTSELAAQGVPDMWHVDNCPYTAQWQLTRQEVGHGESDWETIQRHFRDANTPSRWALVTPMARGSVLPGPAYPPPSLLPPANIHVVDVDGATPNRHLTVFGPDGLPYTRGAVVALDTSQAGRRVIIDQGITDQGQIDIYGAKLGDTLNVVSIDGGLSGHVSIASGLTYSLMLRRVPEQQAATSLLNPHASLIPFDDHDLLLTVAGAGADAYMTALVSPPGSPLGATVTLQSSGTTGVYTGTFTFPALSTGLGSVNLRGVGGQAQRISIDNNFSLVDVIQGREVDLFTPNGQAWLHLDSHSFAAMTATVALMPTGAVPEPLPTGQTAIGAAYSIRASGAVSNLVDPAVLRLFYEPGQLPAGVDPARLRIGWWNGETWQALSSESAADQRAVSAQIARLGIYTILAPVPPQSNQRIFLPFVLR